MSGDTVRGGDVLAVLDTLESAATMRRLRRELSQAQLATRKEGSLRQVERVQAHTDSSRAEANVVRAKANLREELVNVGLPVDVEALRRSHQSGTHVSVDRALAELLAAEAELRASVARINRIEEEGVEQFSAEINVQMLEEQLSLERKRQARRQILAPATGVVTTDSIERLSGANVQGGEVLFEIASLDSWSATLTIREADAPRVATGHRVSLEVPALSAIPPGYAWGTVDRIAREPSGTPGAQGGYRVSVVIRDSDLPPEWRGALRRGYSVRGRIVVRRGTLAQLGMAWLRRRP